MLKKTHILIYKLTLIILIYFVNITTTDEDNYKSVKKVNVLIILIDDMRHLTDKKLKLKNIEKLAATGVVFKSAFAQQSLCAPSRNSLLTGRRPDSLRLYDFYSYWRDAVANYTTIPQFFKQMGYETYSIGKVFHPGKSSNFTDDFPLSWSHVPYHPPSDHYKNAAVCADPVSGKLKRNLVCPVNVIKQPGKTLPDLESLNHAIKVLANRSSAKPFLMAIGFHKPHIPLKFPEEYLDKVPLDEVYPPEHPNIPKDLPAVAWHPWRDVRKRDDISALNISFPFGLMPRKWSLKIRQSYYAASMYMDDLVGELLKHVDLNKTILVLTSDHGWSLGENGLWAKYSNFDVALRVPLIFSIPGFPTASIDNPVELVDIFPTLLDLIGISNTPKCLNSLDKSTLCFDGKSLVQLMTAKKNEFSSETFAISQYPRPSVNPRIDSDSPRLKRIKIMGYSIRTNRFRYTAWIMFNNTLFTRNWDRIYGVELYDHVIDPHETNNLHLHLKYEHIEKYLSVLLRSHIN